MRRLRLLTVGLMWIVLTVIFEFGLGRIVFEFPKLLGQHPLTDSRILAAKDGEAVRAVVRQVVQDHHLPLAADHVERGLDRAVVHRPRRRPFDCGYSHVSTPRLPSYLAVAPVHLIISATVATPGAPAGRAVATRR